ncbi:tyrosine-protein phosphatase [Uliginosibacterium aquaticum]|uniref:protein-tyrosine-phosphatase n=1 Tax=Uliginosibacterium aquaticum TaxID=2731212 RepID=A0ABX2ICP0_9RHOO|nr:CpsB/CapC family capsule biosynthesis tyrosine phosphatase [Uliginosibacterium aquaticum]NSL54047.1 capsular biosynthesis protein [Uliginosibacterium aquaticum]
MIDIHCHLLPGIDDGPATPDEALALARAIVADGIRHVVATPHVFPGRFDNLKAGIEREFSLFRDLLRLRGIELGLSFGGEVRLSHEVLELVQQGHIPFLGRCEGYHTMLLELPDAQIPLGSVNLVRHLVGMGIRPVLVHPERNKAIMEKPDRVGQFVDAGCYLQLTAASLVGQFGPRVLAAADFMLHEGWASAIASDAHNLQGRPPRMREARAVLERRFGAALADELSIHGPARLCGIELGGELGHAA